MMNRAQYQTIDDPVGRGGDGADDGGSGVGGSLSVGKIMKLIVVCAGFSVLVLFALANTTTTSNNNDSASASSSNLRATETTFEESATKSDTTVLTQSSADSSASVAGDAAFERFSDLDLNTKRGIFDDFRVKFNRDYDGDEKVARFQHFQRFLERVDARNAAEASASAGQRALHGITKFADYSPDEYKQLLGYKKSTAATSAALLTYAKASDSSSSSSSTTDAAKGNFPLKLISAMGGAARAPVTRVSASKSSEVTSADWTGVYTTAVKDQGYCGSCWAFSATEQVESDAIRGGLLTSKQHLSVQDVVSCDSNDYGCDGGYTVYAYEYIAQYGIEADKTYPYTSYQGDTGSCSASSTNSIVKTTAVYTFSDKEKEQQMMDYVLETGPLSVCLDASAWDSYVSGVVTSCGTEVDHCVQAVGIDTVAGVWKVRNSWGSDWGDNGFIYLKAGENLCEITDIPTMVDVAVMHETTEA